MTGFTFAIVTDTHVRAPEGDLSSPYPVNDRANGRAQYAAARIAAERPEFTIHLGDAVHPLPHMPAYKSAAAEAKRLLAPIPNLHVVPGNHDIGDKPSPGMPAKSLNSASRQLFCDAFGLDWQTFTHRGARFVLINSSLVNSGLAEETEQRAWLQEVLQATAGERVFLFSHYPPFICDPHEVDHYDNYAEPGRAWLLDLASDNGVEAIFSGHVHHFFYNRYRGVKLFCLPPTSFIRQDYAELFPVAPAPEFGRDDCGKYGFALIDVGDNGFRLRWRNTEGRGETADAFEREPPTLPIIPHLRHAWFEPKSLPYNGPMEEFSRKRARNDYPLLRLLQLGMKTVRTPLSDLCDPVGRRRISDFIALGLKFVFFSIGVPDASALAELHQIEQAVVGLEVLTVRTDLSDVDADLRDLIESLSMPVWLGKVTTSADVPRENGVFAHAVSSGFLPSQIDDVLAILGSMNPAGVVFQIPWGQSPSEHIPRLSARLGEQGLDLVVNLRLAHSNPAIGNFDQKAIQETIRAAIEASRAASNVVLQCDTFESVDRGYSPRSGFVDRLGNLVRMDKSLRLVD
ncbi:MAG: metallophosphoesterase [Pseudomonadota bacterium]